MGKWDEFVNELSAKTGLSTQVLNVWASAENGVNNNILGVTSGGSLMKFSSQTQAADYTANLLKSSPYYSGIIASANQTTSQQAMAIAQSPWHLGPSGLKAQGGTDPYYTRVFSSAGLIGANTLGYKGRGTSTGGAGITIPSVPDVVGGVTNEIGSALSTPIYFIGIVLVGITLMLIGGLITLKPQMEKAASIAA